MPPLKNPLHPPAPGRRVAVDVAEIALALSRSEPAVGRPQVADLAFAHPNALMQAVLPGGARRTLRDVWEVSAETAPGLPEGVRFRLEIVGGDTDMALISNIGSSVFRVEIPRPGSRVHQELLRPGADTFVGAGAHWFVPGEAAATSFRIEAAVGGRGGGGASRGGAGGARRGGNAGDGPGGVSGERGGGGGRAGRPAEAEGRGELSSAGSPASSPAIPVPSDSCSSDDGIEVVSIDAEAVADGGTGGGRAPKRVRREVSGGVGPGDVAGAAGGAAPTTSPAAAAYSDPSPATPPSPPRLPPTSAAAEAPFQLNRVRSAPPWARRDAHPSLDCWLPELLRGAVELALVSNFMIDFPTLASLAPSLLNGPRLVIVHGNPPELEAELRAGLRSSGTLGRTTLHRPRTLPYGTHHSKWFLLSYLSGIRVIIHTANLLPGDVLEKTQGVWWQDFPRAPRERRGGGPAREGREGGDTASSDEKEVEGWGFEAALRRYLTALDLPTTARSQLEEALRDVDFGSARAALVPSAPGYHRGPDLRLWGHMALRAALRRDPEGWGGAADGRGATAPDAGRRPLERPSSQPSASRLVAQSSSLGALDEKWLFGEFGVSLDAGPPGDGEGEGGESEGRPAAPSRPAGPPAAVPALPPSHLSFVWPTVDEVRDSSEGWSAGGSIPAPVQNVSKPLLRPLLRRWAGGPCGRSRAAPHIKTYLRYDVLGVGGDRPPPAPPGFPEGGNAPSGDALSGPAAASAPAAPSPAVAIRWACLTSHNLSRAAWGALQKKGSQLMVRSFELGVLVTPGRERRARAVAARAGGFFDATAEGWVPRPLGPGARAPRGSPAPARPPPLVVFTPWTEAPLDEDLLRGAALGSGNPGEALLIPVPIPYALPPLPYSPSDVPWCVGVPHPGLDCFGRRLAG